MAWNKERPKSPFDKKNNTPTTYPSTAESKKSMPIDNRPVLNSLLDGMIEGREFESLLKYNFSGLNVVSDIRKSISEIEAIRKRPVVCYIGNTVNPRGNTNIINDQDDLPFDEMISVIPKEIREIDIVLVTPGGNGLTIAKLVDKLRPRFDHVGFIILDKAMSAGTIFAMSGDEIIMSSRSQIGPIDPQVLRSNGTYLPALGILSLIEDIKTRGQAKIDEGKQVEWTDMVLLRSIDSQEIGKAINASKYSIDMVNSFLYKYKFREWTHHENGNGREVTDEERKNKALEIAELLCAHDKWKEHGHAINREMAWDICKLKIVHSESIEGLDNAMRRMWALFYWLFEYQNIAKLYVSKDYTVIKTSKENNEKK